MKVMIMQLASIMICCLSSISFNLNYHFKRYDIWSGVLWILVLSWVLLWVYNFASIFRFSNKFNWFKNSTQKLYINLVSNTTSHSYFDKPTKKTENSPQRFLMKSVVNVATGKLMTLLLRRSCNHGKWLNLQKKYYL